MTTTVQSAASASSFSEAASISVAWPAAPTADNLLVAVGTWNRDSGVIGVPTPSTGWTAAGCGLGSNFVGTEIYYRIADGTASDTLTLTPSATTQMALAIAEKSPSTGKQWRTTGLLDGANNGGQSTDTVDHTGSVTTTVADALLVAGLGTEPAAGQDPVTVGSSFVMVVEGATSSTSQAARLVAVGDRTVTTTGSYSTAFTYGPTSRVGVATIAAFTMEDAASEPPATPTGLSAATEPTIELNWDVVAGTGITYDVRKNGTSIIATGVEGTSYIDSDVVYDTTYNYEVRSDEAGLKSNWSASVAHTPSASVPQTEFVWDGTQWV